MIQTENVFKYAVSPVADAFAGTVAGGCVNMKNFQNFNALILKGVGTTGTATITVVKATNAAGANPEAIPFHYRVTNAAGVAGAWTKATTAGFVTTAGSGDIYEVAVSQQTDYLANGDKPFVGVRSVEGVDSPVLGAILNMVSGGRYGSSGSVV